MENFEQNKDYPIGTILENGSDVFEVVRQKKGEPCRTCAMFDYYRIGMNCFTIRCGRAERLDKTDVHLKRKKFFTPYPPDRTGLLCSGMTLGDEESEACPLRDNCKRYKEGTVDPLIFYTFAFGCDDYYEIDPEWEETTHE